jgi:hypothetical protein
MDLVGRKAQVHDGLLGKEMGAERKFQIKGVNCFMKSTPC